MNVNLNNPIVVYYVNTEGMSTQVANDLISNLKNEYICVDINVWIVPIQTGLTRIEMIHQGRY